MNRATAATLLAVALVAGALGGCVVLEPAPEPPGAEKVLVCHKGKTLSVAKAALDAHLRHGDRRGSCRSGG